MDFKLNDQVLEFEPRRIMDVATLKQRMAKGALLYWTMVKPAHAVLYDPTTNKVAQLAFFSKLWGLQRGNLIRHDRYEGIYQVFVPTTPARERNRIDVLQKGNSDELFSQSAPAGSVETINFEPNI